MYYRKQKIALVLALLSICFCSCVSKKVCLNSIQVIGSHNSYKIGIEEPLFNYIYQLDSTNAKSLQYSHISLEEQLDLGLRNLELDVLYDPNGGYYSNPKGLDIIKKMGGEPGAYDVEQRLKKPGLKMFHIQDIDFRSHYLLFKEGLEALKKWSDKNPNHSPIFIIMNTKDQVVAHLRTPLPFTAEALDRIDFEINSVFSKNELITPDLVRGKYATLEASILNQGWPRLKDVKGRFLFVLDEKKDKIALYLKNHESLKDRVLFVNSTEGNPESGFRIVNDPIKDFDYIKKLVAKGYLVRTRADADTKEARLNDYKRFEKAKESGAQVISTDYYLPSTLFKSDYKISFDKNTFERIQK